MRGSLLLQQHVFLLTLAETITSVKICMRCMTNKLLRLENDRYSFNIPVSHFH